ncbi:MAG: hypothetical protein E7564_06545 [Ruminococcaceae bacterium]|nr:hypothetical protein [Oscillospiraceae bacterium]
MYISNLNLPEFKKCDSKGEVVYKTSTKTPCRDPFIMLVGDMYYLYKSSMSEAWGTPGQNKKSIDVICLKSKDLENWCDPVTVLEGIEVSHGVKDMFWAPECHYYKGSYYIFTSVFSNITNHRSVSVYKSSSPEGPFTDIAGGCITPKDWDTIDGTLYVDEDGTPYMTFVHEWTSLPDKVGTMAYAQLSEDFTHFVTEPVELFRADAPEWASTGVTDGPYLIKNSENHLMMIWSNFSNKGYCIGVAHSLSNKIEGPWVQEEKPLYEKGYIENFDYDGGHAMIFKDKEGNFKITFHAPNQKTPDGDFEHVIIRDIIEENGTLKIK